MHGRARRRSTVGWDLVTVPPSPPMCQVPCNGSLATSRNPGYSINVNDMAPAPQSLCILLQFPRFVSPSVGALHAPWLHHAAFLFPVNSSRCSVRWSLLESHPSPASSCLRDLVGFQKKLQEWFIRVGVVYHCIVHCFLFCIPFSTAKGSSDFASAMATTTQSRILAWTAIFFILLTTFITGAQGRMLRGCPCGETYVVRGGESLQMISEKCNDQFILDNNPHIVDHDDLFEGQFLKMDCTQRKINLCDITGALPAYFC